MPTESRIIAMAEGPGIDDIHRLILMAHSPDCWSRRSRAELRPGEIEEAFHDTVSGLDYLFLLNGFTFRRHPTHGRVVLIKDARGLRVSVARLIISSPLTIRGQELRFLRSAMRLSPNEMAGMLGRAASVVVGWEREPIAAIPDGAVGTLRGMASRFGL
jgi:hypothetical protein